MGKQSKKQKYNQWNLEDSLTLPERRADLRQLLERKFGLVWVEKNFPEGRSVERLLSQMEKFKETGYIS